MAIGTALLGAGTAVKMLKLGPLARAVTGMVRTDITNREHTGPTTSARVSMPVSGEMGVGATAATCTWTALPPPTVGECCRYYIYTCILESTDWAES